jgi:hypothetical protein
MQNERTKNIAYWVLTGLLAATMGLTALAQDLAHDPKTMKTLAHLGYPPYFPFITGPAKLLGTVAILVPGYATVKEWAYAGFGILFVSAFISHLASGDGPMAAAPAIAFAILAGSYVLRPQNRRL